MTVKRTNLTQSEPRLNPKFYREKFVDMRSSVEFCFPEKTVDHDFTDASSFKHFVKEKNWFRKRPTLTWPRSSSPTAPNGTILAPNLAAILTNSDCSGQNNLYSSP